MFRLNQTRNISEKEADNLSLETNDDSLTPQTQYIDFENEVDFGNGSSEK